MRDRMDSSGRVRVWNIEHRQWRWVWPVDAREMVKLGVVSMEMPEGETEAAAPEQARRGSGDSTQSNRNRGPIDPARGSSSADGDDPADPASQAADPIKVLRGMTLEQLRETAADYKIKGVDAIGQEELVEAIAKRAGYLERLNAEKKQSK